MRVSKQKCDGHISFSRFYFTGMVVFFMTAILNPVFSQDCVTEDSITKKTERLTNAETTLKTLEEAIKKLPALGPKPTGKNEETAAKTTLDAARIKWDKSKVATEEAKKTLNQGSDATSLAQDIANKKRDLTEKQDEFKKRDLTTYLNNAGKIGELETKLTNNMVDFNRGNANEILNSSSYKKYDPTNSKAINDCIDKLKQKTGESGMDFKPECEAEMGAELLKENNFKNDNIKKLREELQSAVNSTKAVIGTGGSKKNAWDEIRRIGPKLISEIDEVQTELKENYKELEKLEGGIRQMQDEIKLLQTEIAKLEGQLKPITEAEKKETNAKKEYDDAKTKLEEAEKNTEKEKIWIADSTKRKNLETEKNNSATAKANAETEKTNAEAADKKFKEDAEKAYNDASAAYKKMKEEANQAKEALSKPPDPAAVKKIKDKIGKDLLAIKKSLEKYSCIKKVKERLDKLDKLLTKYGTGGSTSIASDMEDPFASLREVPSLDDLDGDTPTDEVPDDIVKNTSEVKVFNVRPGQWLSTGIQLKKGQYFSITAKGLVTREKDRTWGPGGYYFIGFMAYTLKALVGDKLFEIGSDGSGTAPFDGELKLGITSTYEKIGPNDSKLQGSFVATVTIDGK